MTTSNGWSITVGELRRAMVGLPDDYEVMVESADVGSIEIGELQVSMLIPPSEEGAAGLLILSGGQIVNAEYDYDKRLDLYLAEKFGMTWSKLEAEWKLR